MEEQHFDDIEKSARFDVAVDSEYVAYQKRLILQKLTAVTPEPAYAWLFQLARLALVAVFATVLFLPHHAANKTTPAPSSASAQIDFELVKMGDAVELHWKGDTSRVYRVYKGPSPVALRPVEQVKGVAWMDHTPDSSPILFYKIEAL